MPEQAVPKRALPETVTEPPVTVLGFGSYVPKRVMTNEEWSEWVDTSDEWITARTGIKRRRFAADDESTADLAAAAARSALEDAGISGEDLDEIIVATDLPEVPFPDTASFVQHRLGAREIPCYDLGGSGCAGFIQGLDIARSRVMTGTGNVLVIGAEVLTRLMNWRDRSTCVLFGDGAGAVIVGRGGVAELIAASSGTDGSCTDILTMYAGGSHLPFSEEVAAAGGHRDIVMKGKQVFKHAVTRMSQAARDLLERTGTPLEDVSLVIPHQANLRIINAVGSALGLPPERVFVNVQEYGNTGSASVPLALRQARDEGRIHSGDLVLLVAFGAGFHWAAALLRFR